jgi:hypothetical protein
VVSSKRFQPRPHLAIAALLSFIVAFVAARTFTIFFPSTVLVSGSIHIHHFWFGLVLLAAGGWLGISYNDKDSDRLAAILYGAGGGLIADEVGLLLTFGDYWTTLTFSVLVVVLSFATVLILLNTNRQVIMKELREFERSSASIYFGVLLLAVSVAFIAETTNVWVIASSTGTAIAALIIILTFLVQKTTRKRRLSQNSFVSA